MKHPFAPFLAFAIAFVVFAPLVRGADQVVSDSADNGGPNQLRAKLAALQSSGGGTLTFSIGFATIALQQGVLPSITTNTFVDGGGNVTISGADTTYIFGIESGGALTLDNIVLTHGNNATADGGAIRNFGTLTINNCKFLANQTSSQFSGGAILSVGPLTITNSEFGANMAGNGGAIYPRFSAAVTTIAGSSFHDNVATNQTSGWGGALLLWDGASVTIDRSSLSHNAAVSGGGVYVLANSSLTVRDSTLIQNSAVGVDGVTGASGAPPGGGNPGSGGGIYNAGTVTLSNCTLNGNTATGGAGGYGGFLTTNDGGGGGVGLAGALHNSNTATLTNCTLFGNSATGGHGGEPGYDPGGLHTGGGGGIGQAGGILNNGTLTLGSCTVTNNSAIAGVAGGGGAGGFMGPPGSAQAGGILQGGTGSNNVRNDVLAGNAATSTGPDVLGPFTSQGYNLIGNSDASSGFSNGVNHDLVGTGAGPLDARLGGLQDNGGPTTTAALLSDSPAINAGTATGAPARDQRGYVRNNTPDIGAFEFGGTIPVTLANISTRLLVETGDNVLIGGFIITGGGAKRVLLRGIGPSLNVAGHLDNPILELHGSAGQTLASNDNWMDAPNRQAIIDTTIPPANDLESAILMDLDPGSYTAIVRGVGNALGVGLVEAYDLDRTAGSKLANISTRGLVQTGDNVMIGGFIVLGPDSLNVIVRAIGPSLPVAGALADPILELHDSNGALIASNDNWRSDQEAEIIATTIPPSNDLESAIVRNLPPGNYTAVVRGVNNTTGVAVVEAYGLN